MKLAQFPAGIKPRSSQPMQHNMRQPNIIYWNMILSSFALVTAIKFQWFKTWIYALNVLQENNIVTPLLSNPKQLKTNTIPQHNRNFEVQLKHTYQSPKTTTDISHSSQFLYDNPSITSEISCYHMVLEYKQWKCGHRWFIQQINTLMHWCRVSK